MRRSWVHLILKCLLLTCAGGIGLPLLALATVNAVDYYRYHRALHIADRISPAEWTRIAEAWEAHLNRKLPPNFLPVAFRPLHPIADPNNGSGSLYLYRCRKEAEGLFSDGLYLYLSFSKSERNQTIELVSSGLKQWSNMVVWVKDPAEYRRHHPLGRLLTLYEGSQTYSRKWIVLPQSIAMVDERQRIEPGSIQPLSEDQQKRLKQAIAAIPAEFRGRLYTSGGLHGISCDIRFSTDGEAGPTDIRLHSTWRDEVGLLLAAIAECLPEKSRPEYRERLERQEASWGQGGSVSIYPISKTRSSGTYQLPGWCLWPYLFGADMELTPPGL